MLCCATVCSALTGCSLSGHLERASADLERQYAETKAWDELPLHSISWEQALAMLRRNNAELQEAQRAIDRAERDALSVYTDLIPNVTYYSYANKAIADLTNTWSKDDFSRNINVTFNIPTLTQVPYRVYATRATAYAAVKRKEGVEREQISKLYQMLRKQEISAAQKALEAQEPATEQELTAATLLRGQSDEHNRWAETAALLGDYSARWNILPETMPHIRWAAYRDRLDKLDPLTVCLFVMKLEQARMAQYSVALRYLPTINTSLYSPSLFSSSGGTYSGSFLDSRDTKLNMGINYALDTQLRTWDTYRSNKENYEKAKLEVATALIEHKDKVAALRRSMDDYTAWLGYMHKRMDYLRHAPVQTAAEFLEHRQELLRMERELLNQESQGVESEAALVLEYGMPQ